MPLSFSRLKRKLEATLGGNASIRSSSSNLADGAESRPRSPLEVVALRTPNATEQGQVALCTPDATEQGKGLQLKVESCGSLWDRAYQELRDQKRSLVDAFENLLISEPEVESTTSSADGDASKREKQMSALVDKKLAIMNKEQWRFEVGGKSVEVREQVDRIVKVVLVAKDFISSVAQMDPMHAGLPWAGVCTLLNLLVKDSEQRAATIDGLEYISKLVRRYAEIELIYFRSEQITLKEDLEAMIIKLYFQILEYEARAACQFNRNTAFQQARNIVEADSWKTILGKVKESETACDQLLRIIDAKDQRASMRQLEDKLDKQNHEVEELLRASRIQDEEYERVLVELRVGREEQKVWRQTDEECICHQALRTSNYEEYKARNPDRVDGTCQWFLQNPKFQHWWKSEISSILWVSADPGCGKSVLSKSLVDNELSSTESRTTCYFFFKDDNVDQKNPTNVLCALLHQLFSQNSALIKYALPEFRREGPNLSRLFIKLWGILVAAADDPKAGEIICVLDALDECEESDRYTIIETLSNFYRHSAGKNATLKFLVTSRPYYDIERRFKQLTCQIPTVRLAGEQETESISKEINLVIKARVQDIGLELGLDESVQSTLENELLNVPHRTYLWLKLILEVIRNRLDITEKKLRGIIGSIPDTVDKAYEAILAKSTDKIRAETLLHIVVSAIRPLTLREMNVALAIKEGSRSEEELDLEREEQFRITVRNLCGLFVSVIDSRIYLIHQTAKDFLVRAAIPTNRASSSQGYWKHSLAPVESNLILAKACISYLLFTIFESDPPVIDRVIFFDEMEIVGQYTCRYGFLDYSAKYWATHFREAKVEEMAILESVLEICDTRSMRFRTWFDVYWTGSNFDRPDSTILIVGSYFGHEAVVKLLLEKGANPEAKGKDDLTPLLWATIEGHKAAVKLLLEKSANLEAEDKDGLTPLWWAIYGEHWAVIKLLLEKGANLEAEDKDGWTPLMWAARLGRETVVKLLLEKGANLEAEDKDGRTPLTWAARLGRETVVKLLLEKGANLEAEDDDGQTPLLCATKNRNEAVVKLLLEKGTNLEAKDNDGQTPLLCATKDINEAVVKLLLEKGAKLEAEGKHGQTPLLWAAIDGHEAVVKLLLEKGANLEAKDEYSRTPLIWAAICRHEAVVKLLLERGANLEAKDKDNRTPLIWAAQRRHEAVVKLLLKKDANLEAEDKDSRTPLLWAAMSGQEAVLKLLLEKGANIEATDKFGLTPLWWATKERHEAVVKLLLEKGANLEAEDNDGQTPLTWATDRGHKAVVKLLLEKGAAILEVEDNDDQTLLSWAIMNRNEAVVKLLLEKGTNLEAKDNDGQTLLCATKDRNEAVVKQLLENGANLEAEDEYGRTPLIWAAMSGQEAVLKLLLEKGANIEATDKFGLTPLWWATKERHEAVLKLLTPLNPSQI